MDKEEIRLKRPAPNVEWDRVVTRADDEPVRVPETLWELVASAAEANPNAVIALDEHARTLTRARLRDDGLRVAAALAGEGIESGTVVSWQLPTVLEALVLMVALARLGTVQNPIIPLLRHREVGFITAQVNTEVFITPETWRAFDHANMAREVTPDGARVLALDLRDLSRELCLPIEDDVSLVPPTPPEGGVRWLYYSSGTTADPKGVRHRDDAIMASCAGMLGEAGFRESDVYPIAWPLTHIGGATMLTTSLVGGATLVLTDDYDAKTTPDAWAAFHPTIVGTAVPFFRAYLDAQALHGAEPLFPDLRVATWGGGPVPAEVHHEMHAAFGVPLVGSYGLTEFPIASSAEPGDAEPILVESVGRAAPGVSIRIVRADGSDAPTGGEGEVRLRGPQCFEGYVDATLDAEAFDGEGWFRTGDLGTLDTEGYLRITGRLKDIVIRNAENISVVEVEDLLFRHPAILDAAVFGVPDPRTGERVCAVVVLGEASLSLEDLRAFCRDQGLARHKCPEQLERVESLRRSAMGKVEKAALRTRFAVRN